MKLSILIVNYRSKEYLEHCLVACTKAVGEILAEILVADNGAGDDLTSFFNGKFPQVKFFELSENIGFSRANNFLLQQARGSYTLFLNPDTIIGENTLKNSLNYLINNRKAGALGVKMVNGQGEFLPESKRNIPAAKSGFMKMIGLEKPGRKISTTTYYDNSLSADEIGRTKILSGAFLLLSPKAKDLSAGFDEKFFMYGEDIDLSVRLLKNGLENHYLGSESIIHFKGKSNYDQKAHVHHFFEAMNIYTAKHYASRPYSKKFMQAGVLLGKWKSAFASNFKKKPTINFKHLWAVIGNSTQIDDISKLLMEKGADQIKPIELTAEIDNKLIMHLIPDLLNEGINHMVFCQGFLNFKTIISALEQNAGKITAFIHTENSRTIAGDQGIIYL